MAGETNPYDAVVASMPPPGANPYDAVVADLGSSNAAKASVIAAQGSNPDVTARALKVSAGLGVPMDVVERNLPDFEGLDKLARYDAIIRTSPTMLKRWMMEPVNARLVGDDLPVLAGTASLWRGLADAGRSMASGVIGFAGSALAGTGEAYDVTARTVGRLAGAAGVPSTGATLPWYLDPAQILKRPGQSIKAFADDIAVPPERKNLVDQVAEGVGQIGGQAAAVMATGGAGGLAMLFGQGVDQMADDVRKSGKAGTVAGDATLVGGGMVTAIAEKLGLDLLVRRLPPAIKNKLARAVVDIAAAGGIEAAEEAVEQVGQNALSNYYLETHKNLLDGTLDSAIPAGGAAAFVRALLVSGGRLRKRQLPNVEQAAADAAALDQVMATVRGTGLARRSPKKLAELLSTMGDGGTVYVPAAVVRTYLQSVDPQEARKQVGALGIDGQLEQAMATGGDVVIPLHQYVAHAPEGMAAAWRDDLRLRAQGLSVNDARRFKEGAAQLDGIVAGRLDEVTRRNAARDEIVAVVEKQLLEAGESPETARLLAELYGERYVTRAARLGEGDAASQYGRSGVEFRSDPGEVKPRDVGKPLPSEAMDGDAARTYEQRDTFPAEFMSELAQVDELFRYRITRAQTPQDALRDVDPSISFLGDVTREDEHSESGAERRLMFRTGRGHDFYVYEHDRKLWADLSQLAQGESGSAIYAALFTYASNTDRQFVGDPNPAALSDIALRRRTEAMLSSAIRHGSTDHMEPHPRQVSGDTALGVPPLAWHVGDTLGNIQSLIDVSLASLASKVPEFQRARYDFATRTFRTGEGKPLTDGALARWADGKGRDREARAGSATYKRGILLNTLVRAPGRERPGLLERVLSQPRQQVGASARDIFYQRRDALSVLGPRGSVTFTKEDRERLTAVIALFKNRNRSTVLHETGHLWLEELQADGALPHAPEALKADLATVRAYLGAKGDAPLTVEQHEKWARTVEAYFLEGRSPSVALSAVLARFKGWLLSVYKTMKALNVDINDDVRGVLDRMIATDEAIAEAQAEVHAGALPVSDIAAGMTEAERQAHAESIVHAGEIARRAVLAASMGDIQRRRTPRWKAEARALRKEIQRTIDSQPDIAALRYLRDGTLPNSLAHLRERPRLRLSREALAEEHGHPAIADTLPRSFERLVTDSGGVRPAEIAGLLGFPGSRSMIDALTALAKEQVALKRAGDKRSVRTRRIDDAVERAMAERHGPALFDGSIEGQALSGLHSKARANVLAAEVRALARRAGKMATSYKEARDWARRVIEQEPVGKIGDLGLLTRAEARAAFAADEALAGGDIDAALRHKQEQMIAHALWREARDANKRAEVARRKMERRAAARMMDAASDGVVEDDVTALPSARSSEGGPGVWRAVPEWMKPRAAAYQRQITGEISKAYIVKGVKFDGFMEGTLLEVKGPGYASLMKNGEFKKRLRTREKLLKQANDQVEAANGVPIVWHIAEAAAAEAIRKLLRIEKVKGIAVLNTPAVPLGR